MPNLPEWLAELQRPLDNESPGAHVARIVRALDGLSLVSHADKLAELFGVNEPSEARARLASQIRTNCATIMRCVWALAGCTDVLIVEPYQSGLAVAWDLQAARELGALRPASEWESLGPGWGLHYASVGQNNDHVEFCLTSPDGFGNAEHGGGGRAQNAITIERGYVRWSLGRPLVHIIDPDRMVST